MTYEVNTPFVMDGKRLGRGVVLGQDIEKVANFKALLADGYLSRRYDKKTGEEYLERTYRVEQKFNSGEEVFKPGDIVDLNERKWRNEQSLLRSGYLKKITQEDVARQAQHSPQGTLGDTEYGAPGVPEKKELWKDSAWLIEHYVNRKESIPELSRIAECSVSTIWHALKSNGLSTRPRGRPTKG